VSEPARLRAISGTRVARSSATPASRSLGRAGRRQRRRRRAAGLVRFAVFLLLIFVAVWAGVRVAHASVDGAVYTGHRYTVQAGDDLWTIASGEYGGGVDLRKAVYAIREANHLGESAIQPGLGLTLPYLGQ
jgi:nucleoid-associated protein YgaU